VCPVGVLADLVGETGHSGAGRSWPTPGRMTSWALAHLNKTAADDGQHLDGAIRDGS
jgi:hypothetical protein